jgi:hypothetical protein
MCERDKNGTVASKLIIVSCPLSIDKGNGTKVWIADQAPAPLLVIARSFVLVAPISGMQGPSNALPVYSRRSASLAEVDPKGRVLRSWWWSLDMYIP